KKKKEEKKREQKKKKKNKNDKNKSDENKNDENKSGKNKSDENKIDENKSGKNKNIVVGRAEEFYLNCLPFIDDFLDALRFLKFAISINYVKEDILSKILKINLMIKNIRNCDELVNFLRISLYIGNVLNNKSYLGRADAFTLDSIEAFANVRGKDNISPVDLIIKKIDIKKIIDSLKGIEKVSLINISVLLSDKDNFMKEYLELKNNKNISEKIKIFEDDVKIIESEFEDFKRNFKDLNDFFGCDEKIFKDLQKIKNLIENFSC
ncbi:Formin-like protein 14, partial [Dictyocoela muelleri]